MSPIGVTYKSSILNKNDIEEKPVKGNKKIEQQTQTYAEDFEEENNISENEEYGGNIEEGSSPTEQEEEEECEMSDTHNSNINTKRSSNRVSNNSINPSSKRASQMSVKSSHSSNYNTISPKRKSNMSQKAKLNSLEEDIKKNNNNNNKPPKVNNPSNKTEAVNSNNNEVKEEEKEKAPKQQQESNNNNNNDDEIDVVEDAFEFDEGEEEKVRNINRPITDKEYETVCALCIESMITELIEDEEEEEMGKLGLMIDTNVQKPPEQSLNSKIRKSIAEVQNVYLNKIDDMPKSRRASKMAEEIEKKADELREQDKNEKDQGKKEQKKQEKKDDEEVKKVNIDDDDELKKLAEIPSPDPMSEIILPDSNGNPQPQEAPPPALEVKTVPKRMATPIMEEDDDEEEEPDEAEEVDVNKKYANVFNDPITRAFLKAYMIKNFQEESIIFWETVKELEDIAKRVSKPQRKEYCQEIFDKFIKEGSEMEININASLRIKITDRIKKHVYL